MEKTAPETVRDFTPRHRKLTTSGPPRFGFPELRRSRRNLVRLLALTGMAALAAASGGRPQASAPAGPATYDPASTYPVEKLRADLATLWNVLDEGHPAFDRYTPAPALKSAFDEASNGLTSPLTELDFIARLLPLIALVGDGHTSLQPSLAAERFLDTRPVTFPFVLRLLEDKAFIFRNLSPDRSISDGSELLSIDGKPAMEIVGDLARLVSNDAAIRTGILRRLEPPGAFGRLLALRFGHRESFRLRVRPSPGRDIRESVVAGIAASEVGRVLAERYRDAVRPKPLYELAFRGRTAVLTIRGFADDPREGSPAFERFLADAFGALERDKAPYLVIDLRGNGGGRDDYGKLLFAHVMDRPFPYYRSMTARKDRFDLFRFTERPREDAAELAAALAPNADGGFDVAGHPNLGPQSPAVPRFAGKVAILIDGASRSTTGEVLSLFHYHGKAVFVGEESGAGYHTATSFIVTATLPNTGIRLRMPLVLTTLAVVGHPLRRGVVPDAPVSPTIEDLVAGRDPALEKAVSLLEGSAQR